jgi:hypothetical protein
MTHFLKHPIKKHPSDQETFIEAPIEWVIVKLIYFRSVNHPLFREILHRADPDFFVLMHNALGPHIKRLADLYRQLPED